MDHLFKLGQFVRLGDIGFAHGTISPNHLYEVMRLMPADEGGEFGYRLRSDAGERAARQSEILDAAETEPI